jgi:hypothetical protein
MHRRVSRIFRFIPPALALCLLPVLVVAGAIDVPAVIRHAPPDPDGDPPQWLNRAVFLFDQGALANELKGVRPVTKWAGSIDIAVRGDAGRAWLARVERIADDLSLLTGRSITVDDNPLWAGDMDVYVTRIRGFRGTWGKSPGVQVVAERSLTRSGRYGASACATPRRCPRKSQKETPSLAQVSSRPRKASRQSRP